MKKTLLIIENDFELQEDRHSYVLDFKEKFDGEVIVMTGFGSKSVEEIKQNLLKATDIVVQTCFVNGSDSQFYEMFELLSKFPKPLNIHIALLGDDLEEYILNHLEPEQLHAIKHHTIYDFHCEKAIELDVEEIKLDFTHITRKYDKKLTKHRVHKLFIQHYKDTAHLRPTGRKIRIIDCKGFGPQFKDLPIGEIVDELDCVKLEEKKKGPYRGVWIMGNGEPIKLINDAGWQEYKIVTKLSIEELLEEIEKTTTAKITELSRLQLNGLITVIESNHEEDDNMSKANFICEELQIPKRSNRRIIYELLENNS